MVVLKIDKTVPTPGTSPKADVIVRVASFLNLERLLVRVPLLLLFPITALQVAGSAVLCCTGDIIALRSALVAACLGHRST